MKTTLLDRTTLWSQLKSFTLAQVANELSEAIDSVQGLTLAEKDTLVKDFSLIIAEYRERGLDHTSDIRCPHY